MELKLMFNEDAQNYDKSRPTYTAAVFEEIIKYAQIEEGKQALEIGIGTGQATLPFIKTGCRVTAIELGENLAAYSKEKFKAYSNFNVINTDFESYAAKEDCIDLVYSATAFHWIPDEVGYKKVFDLLQPGGTIALFWNHPYMNRKDYEVHVEMQKVYQKYLSTTKLPTEFSEDKCSVIKDKLKHYGFKDIQSKLFYNTRQLNTQEYINLLNTYSDHRALPEDIKRQLEEGIVAVINQFGGTVNIYDTVDLYLARKP